MNTFRRIEKAQGATNTEGFAEQTTDTSNFATDPMVCKAIRTKTAEFALAGYVVQQMLFGDFMVTNHEVEIYCKDLTALDELAKKMGVSHAI